ncbi:hypothetical protein [Ilumatobacter nonamiensis]|uniref:hypothetical protein n=1 Tax=Ilumatobacter nonamiensis TaxID=467093 RepID=UPI00058C4864|nr:hypothetical protein [Ilumatobacter nonamiensis]
MSLCIDIEQHVNLLRRSTGRGDLADWVRVIRRVDERSDEAIRQLLERHDESALEVVLVALIPMLRHRCRNDRTQADEALGELSIVLAEFSRSGVPATGRRLANLIVDKAWDAHRCTMRRERRAAFPVDPRRTYLFDEHSIDPGHRQVLDRAALHDFRDQLVKSHRSHPKASAAWNEALDLALMERRTSVQRNRWKYVRQQLRKLAPPELSV